MTAQAQELELPPLADGRAAVRRGWASGWRVPEVMWLDEWADTHRRLPKEASAEYGQWRTDRNPLSREIMRALSPQHPAQWVVLKAGTQLGKTEIGTNWVLSIIHQTPGPLLVVLHTIPQAKRWSRQRFAKSLAAMPVMNGLIKSARSRDSGNTLLEKEFPGGFMVMAGANSSSDLRSTPVRFLYLDEVDKYPDDLDDEGDAVTLAERRTSTFSRRKIFLTSSPTLKDSSEIDSQYEESTQHRPFVPCPHCGNMHVLEDKHLQDDGTFVCPPSAGGCGAIIEEHHKEWMFPRHEWRARFPERKKWGFHWPSYYASLGLGYSWKEIAEMRTEARKKPEKEKVYVNTIMGEAYDDPAGKVEWEELKERAGGYALRTIPRGCLMLTAGIDTQDDRLAVILLGWGRGEKLWIIDYVELPGDPADEQVWLDLDAYLDKPIENSFGIHMRPELASVDSGGHHTHTVYNYCRDRKHLGRLAVKGDRFPGKPVIATRPRSVDLNIAGQTIPSGAELWFIGTDTAKGWLFQRLMADGNPEKTPSPDEVRVHLPEGLPDEFFRQFVGERFDVTTQRWKKIRGRRVEVLDCFVYGFAAANHPLLRVQTMRELDWKRREEQYEPMVRDLFADPPSAEPAKPRERIEPAPAQQQQTGFGSDDWCL